MLLLASGSVAKKKKKDRLLVHHICGVDSEASKLKTVRTL